MDTAHQKAVDWICHKIVLITEGKVVMGDLNAHTVFPLDEHEYEELIQLTGFELAALVDVRTINTIGDYADQIEYRFQQRNPALAALIVVALGMAAAGAVILFSSFK